jgi:hypothetical protein
VKLSLWLVFALLRRFLEQLEKQFAENLIRLRQSGWLEPI